MEVLSYSAAVQRKPNHPASLILSHINYSKITHPSTPQRVRDKGRGEANMWKETERNIMGRQKKETGGKRRGIESRGREWGQNCTEKEGGRVGVGKEWEGREGGR